MPACDFVADAILNCETVQEAIATLIATNTTVQGALRGFVTDDDVINQYITEMSQIQVLTEEQRGTNLLKPDACDYGYTFNQASKLVFLLDQLATDIFQAVEVGTNSLERAELLSGLLGTGRAAMTVQLITSVAEQLVEELSEDYQNTYGQSLYDDLRCGIWCEFKDTCELTIDEVHAFYKAQLDAAVPDDPIDSLKFVMEFLLTAAIPGNIVVYAMHLLVIELFRTGQVLLGVDFTTVGLRLLAAGDEIDNDWETLCTECADAWCKTIDLKGSNGAADGVVIGAPDFPYSAWVSGEGVRSTTPDDRVWFGQNMPSTIDLDEVEIEWEYVPGETFTSSNVWLGQNGNEGSPTAIGADQTSFTRTGLTGVEDLVFIIERAGSNETRLANFTRITLRGTGTNPFGASNC